MAETLGTIRGQLILDVRQALASYTAARQQHISTVTALHTGAGAMTASGAAIAGVGAIMAAGFLTAVDAAAKFEKKLDIFGAVSDSTQAEYEAISEKALQLGADTIYSAGQIADSFIELAKSGVDAQGIIDGIGDAVANLGAATDLPLTEAATSLTTILNTFGLEATDAVAVVDKLSGAANSSSIDVTDLITTMTYAGASAKTAGISFEDINTSIALLGERGIKGSKAGTGLRQVIDKLIAPTKTGTSALKELGIITEDGTNKLLNMDGSLKPIPALLDSLNAALPENKAERIDILGQIFPITSLPTVLNLIDGGSAGIARLNEEINKTTALEIAGKRLNNLSGDIEILSGNLDTLLISGGGGFQGFARTLVQGLTDIVQAFMDLPSGVQTSIFAVIAIVAAILLFVGTLGIFAGAILNMTALALQLGTAFPGLMSAFGALVTGLRSVIAVTWAWTASLLANPVVLIVVGILALIAALVFFFTQTELGREVWANFTQFLTEAWANISSFAITVFTELGNFFTELWANVVGFFTEAINFIVDLFYNFNPVGIIISNWSGIVAFFTELWTSITTGITSFIDGSIAFFQALPNNIVAFFQALPQRIGYIIGFVVGTIVRGFMMAWTWITTNVPLIINNVVSFFQALPGQVIGFFTDLYNGAVLWLTTMAVQSALKTIEIVNGIITFFKQLPGKVISFFQAVYTNAVTWLTALLTAAIARAQAIYQGIVQFIQQIPGKVIGFFQDMYNRAIAWITSMYNKAIEIAKNISKGVTDGINGLPGLVSGIFNKVVDAIKGAISGAVKAVTSFATGLWEGFKDGLGIHSPSYIEHAMWAITGVIEDETQKMKKQVRTLQGLGNGISEIGNNIGFGDTGLQQLYESVAATKALEIEYAANAINGSTGQLSPGASDATSPTSTTKNNDNSKTFYVTPTEDPITWARAVDREYADESAG